MTATHINLNNQQQQDVWTAILDKIRNHMGLAVFNTWFANLSFKEIKDDTITITAPSRFIREWILTNYYSKLKEFASAETPCIKRIDLRVKTIRSPHKEAAINEQAQIEIQPTLTYSLDRRFIFENFVVGESNRFAYAAARAVAEEGIDNNLIKGVLYIHGSVGMGKTHLLQSIAQHLNLHKAEQKVMYISAEKFMHQYIKAVKTNDTYSFKESLRELDILLFDDIQFICGKSGTQQEFANTLNAMMESGKIVVTASDRSPYDLGLDQRTTSRLTGGLVTEIKKPNLELYSEILKFKATQFGVDVPVEVLSFIAKTISSSIRESEAALNKIIASASLLHHPIDLSLTKEVLKDCVLAHEASIPIERIIEVVSNYYGITQAELLSKTRTPKVVYPRQMAAFLAKQVTDKSLQEIGYKMGKRDHATIIYSVKKLEERMAKNSTTMMEANKLIDLLSSI